MKISVNSRKLLESIEALPKIPSKVMVPRPEQIEALRLYWHSGRRKADIADALGVSKGTAIKWYRRYVSKEG